MYEPTRDVDAEHAGSIVAAALLAMNLFCPVQWQPVPRARLGSFPRWSKYCMRVGTGAVVTWSGPKSDEFEIVQADIVSDEKPNNPSCRPERIS
jgi:hypothetical protein